MLVVLGLGRGGFTEVRCYYWGIVAEAGPRSPVT